MVRPSEYGLELTNNSKVGWAFSISRSKTCINATDICKRLCYGNGIRYQSKAAKEKRERHYRTVQFLLSEGGPELLAENLVALIDNAKPRDWLCAKITGVATVVPWTLRIHDVGDFFSVDYVEAWVLAAQARPFCSLWFYTRSFDDEPVFDALGKLAGLSNCQGWLSADSENFEKAILAKSTYPTSNWKIALLQDRELSINVVAAIESVSNGDTVSFPHHRAGRHVEPIKRDSIVVCPSITGKLRLTTHAHEPRPCQICQFCLP